MYKIMLVEDEALVRESMMQNIDWGHYGFELVCACENGREAIEQLGTVIPDVVVTDICMPFVDGLELARHIQEHFPAIFVVILTGFNEFSYAQQAIKLRVHDFVLKPVVPREFCAILSKLSADLTDRDSRRDDIRVLQSRANQAEVMLKNTLFRQLLHNSMTTPEILAAAKHADLTLDCAVYCALFCKTPHPPQSIPESQRLLDAAQTTATRFPHCTSVLVEDRYLMILMGGRTQDEVSQRVRDAAVMLSAAVSKSCGVSTQIGIGTCCSDLSGLHRCFKEAHHATGYCFTGDRAIVIDHQARATERPATHQDPLPSDRDILKALEAHDETGAQQLLERLFHAFAKRGLHRSACVPILERLRFSLTEMIPPEAQNAAPQIPPSDDWQQAAAVEQAFSQLIAFIHRLARPAEDDPALRCVESAKGYIQQHFHDSEFSLAELLSLLNVSKSYFSSVFKAQTGQTFVEYLTAARMEKAKHLLKSTNLCTYEIAERTGFSDPHYFSVTFKRYVGKTPRDFREEPIQ